MHAMRHKVGGPDDWQPRHLLKLPTAWWMLAADLWNHILHLGRVPSMWKEGCVALLWKTRQRTRPTTLLTAMWRAGARCLQRQLAPWVESWKSAHDSGGLPGTSVQGALMQVHQAQHDGATHFVQMDVGSYFDSIHMDVLERAMAHLRFPAPILTLLKDFYQGARRIFSMQPAHGNEWHTISLGLAQGCPLSPILAAGLGHIWGSWVSGPLPHKLVGCVCFVDDRTLWRPPEVPLQNLQKAVDLSNQYDTAFGFKLSLEKCAVVTRHFDAASRSLAGAIGFDLSQTLEVLGVVAHFDSEWRLLKFQARRAILRMRLLRWTTKYRAVQQKVLSSLVTPCYAWAAGFARPSPEEMHEICSQTTQVFASTFTQGPARALLFEAISWHLEPNFACDLGALRVLWKSCAVAPSWLDLAPISNARFCWQSMIPEAQCVLSTYSWTLDAAGHV